MGAKEADDVKLIRGRMVDKRRRIAIDPKFKAEGKVKHLVELQHSIRVLDEIIADELKDPMKPVS